jgi:pyruvate dehydrogenase E1 component
MRRDESIETGPGKLDEICERARSLAETVTGASPGRTDRAGSQGWEPWRSAGPILTALRFGHAAPPDVVAVEPEMIPLCWALEHLAGTVDHRDPAEPPDVPPNGIWRLRSVNTNPLIPLFAAVAARAVDAGTSRIRAGRRIAVVSDAALESGQVWEALTALSSRGCSEVMLVVDVNHRRPGGYAPDSVTIRTRRLFSDAGWHVLEARHGWLRREAFARPGGDSLRHHLDSIGSGTIRELGTSPSRQIRERILDGAEWAVADLLAGFDDQELADLIRADGGSDPSALLDCFRASDEVQDRPSVVFAHTSGLPDDRFADTKRDRLAATGEVSRSTVSTAPAGPRDRSPAVLPPVPASVGAVVRAGRTATATALGPLLRRLEGHEAGRRLVTCWSPRTELAAALSSSVRSARGSHLNPGDSVPVFLTLLGELGMDLERVSEVPLPLGVSAGLGAGDISSVQEFLTLGSRFVLVDIGTDVPGSLAPGGARAPRPVTSDATTTYEPAFATELDWVLCHALDRIFRVDGGATMLRVSPSRVAQEAFGAAFDRIGGALLRRLVLAGGYRLVEPSLVDAPSVTIIGSGPVLVDAVSAAAELEGEGVAATVVNLTGPDSAARELRGIRTEAVVGGRPASPRTHLENLVQQPQRHGPLVTVHESAAALEWVGGALGVFQIALGENLTAATSAGPGLSPDHIVNAALVALDTAG